MRNRILSIGFSYAASLISFLTTLLLARLLGAEAFGIVALGLAVGAFASPFVNLGTDRVFVRDFLRTSDPNDRCALTHRNLVTRASMAILVLIAMLALAIGIGSSSWERTALASLFMWAALLGGYPTAWYDAIGKVAEQNALNLGEKTFAFAFVIAIYFAPPWFRDPAVAGIVLLSTRIISLAIQYALWWRSTASRQTAPNLSLGFADSGTSFRITAVLLVNACVVYGNQILLEVSRGRLELGAFGIGFQAISLVLLFQAQALRLIAREIVRASERPESIVFSMFRHAGLFFVVSTVLATAAWVLMNFLPTLLGDDRFGRISEFAIPLCVWAAIVGAGQVISQYLVCSGAERTYLRIAAMGAILTLSSGLVLIPDGGARMVALVLLVVHTTMICLQGLAVFRNAGPQVHFR